jgi:hypothetical protein
MDRRRNSSFDQNLSREGRQERRDQTSFLKPERSRSAPPELEKSRIQEAKDAFEFLETQGVKLTKNFKNLLMDLIQNIEEDRLSLKEGQFSTYKSLVQSYTIYNGNQFALEINKHNNYLTIEQLNKLRLNSNKLEKLREATYIALKAIDPFRSLIRFTECSNRFIAKSRNRNGLAKDLNSFLENIQANQKRNLPLNEEQVKTYEDLTSRSHEIFTDFNVFTSQKTQLKDNCNEEQQDQMKREVQLIRSTSANVDKIVQSLRLAHPTFRDLRSQRDIIGKRYSALLASYEKKRRCNLPSSKYEHEWNELCEIRQFIQDYESTINAFNNTEYAKHLDKQQNNRLQLDKKMVQHYTTTIEKFLASREDSD